MASTLPDPTMTTTPTSTSPSNNASPPNLDFLFSEPLLDAALAQIKTFDQFRALQNNFEIAQNQQGKVISDTIQAKLQTKERSLQETLVKDATQDFLQQSGLKNLVDAKAKWDDVHFMAEAHGVGSSIPMVSYTGLSQSEFEQGLGLFYKYLDKNIKNNNQTDNDPELQKQVGQQVLQAYRSLYETATGEFGGYEPFDSMVEHTPEHVESLIFLKKN